MKTITLTNDFHNSSVALRCELLQHAPGEFTIYPSVGQIKKAKKALCGINGCMCSGDDGHRGPQSHNGQRLVIDLSSLYSASK